MCSRSVAPGALECIGIMARREETGERCGAGEEDDELEPNRRVRGPPVSGKRARESEASGLAWLGCGASTEVS